MSSIPLGDSGSQASRAGLRITPGSAPPPGWFVKRVSLRGVDVTTSGFDVNGNVDGIEVVFTDRATTVTGSVRDASSATVRDYIVAFFPSRPIRWGRSGAAATSRSDPTQTGCTGSATCRREIMSPRQCQCMSLPIGGEWDPEFAERVKPRAIGLKLTEGQSLALTHRLIE